MTFTVGRVRAESPSDKRRESRDQKDVRERTQTVSKMVHLDGLTSAAEADFFQAIPQT